MRYILTSKQTGREHLLDETAYMRIRKQTGFHAKYSVQEIPERKPVSKPIELELPVVDKRRKRVEEPKTVVEEPKTENDD